MKKKIWIVSAIIFFMVGLNAQQDSCHHSIEGHVYDILTEEPLMAATIEIEGTGLATITNSDGSFYISGICDLEFDILINYLGYKKLRHHHDFHHPDLEIYLAPDAHIIEGVVIEEQANPSNLTSLHSHLLTREDLELIRNEALGDIVSRLPGVSTIKTGQNIATPMIHGLHSSRIVILNNDVRHEYQNWSEEHAPEIDPSLVDNVQVIKGAATVRYGPDALGGVILLNPRDVPLSSDANLQFRLIGKSNGKSAEGDIQYSKGFDWMTIMAGATWLKQGDLHAPEYNLSNTGKLENSVAGSMRFHISPEIDARISYSRVDQELGILRGAVNGNLEDLLKALQADIPNDTEPFTYDISPPKQENVHSLIKTEINYITDKQAANFVYSYQNNHHQEFDVRRGNDLEIPNIDLELQTHNIDADWTHPAKGTLRGKIGIQWKYRNNANLPGTNTVPFVPNYLSSSLGMFVIESYEFEDQTLEAGLRFDWFSSDITGRKPNNDIFRNEINYQNVSAIVGWKNQFSEDWLIRSNLGTAWRPPNIAELYRFGRRGTFIEYGLWRYMIDESEEISTEEILTQNDRAVPSEKGYKWINSLEINKSSIQAELSGYVNFIKNYIYARPAGLSRTVRGTAPFFIYDQVDALFFGFDFSSRWMHSKNWNSDLRASYVWAKQIDDNDNFTGIPPASAGYAIKHSFQSDIFGASSVQIDLDYHFKQHQTPRILTIQELLNAKDMGIDLFRNDASDFDIADSPDDYLLVNISWLGSLDNFRWNFRVTNLLHASYRAYTDRLRYFTDDIGRNFIASFQYSF